MILRIYGIPITFLPRLNPLGTVDYNYPQPHISGQHYCVVAYAYESHYFSVNKMHTIIYESINNYTFVVDVGISNQYVIGHLIPMGTRQARPTVNIILYNIFVLYSTLLYTGMCCVYVAEPRVVILL
jgi:hypothetical protein